MEISRFERPRYKRSRNGKAYWQTGQLTLKNASNAGFPSEIADRMRRPLDKSSSSNSGARSPAVNVSSCFFEAILLLYICRRSCCEAINSGSQTVENGGA